MNDCVSTEMRDALPDLIHGTLDAVTLARVEAHVASCVQCAAELDVLRSVVSSAPAVPPISIQRIVSTLPVAAKQGFLLHRGNGEAVSTPATALKGSQSVWSRPVLRVAAAIAVIAAGGLSLLVGRDVLNPATQVGGNNRVAVTSAPVAGTGSATVATSESRAAELSWSAVQVASAGSGLLMSEVQQLSDEHLLALLSEVDSIDAVPVAEPETIVPAFADSDTSEGTE